eukprot:3472658-Prymnesium_polylepis.1
MEVGVSSASSYANAADLARGVERLQQSWILPGVDPAWPVVALCAWDTYVLAAARNRSISLYDVAPAVASAAAPRLVVQCLAARAVQCLAASGSVAYLVDGGNDVSCHHWSAAGGVEGTPHARLVGHTRAVTALAYADGLVYSGANDLSVRLWDAETGNLVATLAQDLEPPSSLSVLESIILSASHIGGGEC